MHETLAFHPHWSVVSACHRAGLAGQECGQVPRYSRVLRVGQGHLREACATRHLGQICDGRFGKEPIGQHPRQFATQQNVIAHRHAREGQFPVFGRDGDQRKIGCAAAHIHDQHDIPGLNLLAEPFAHLFNPSIESRLWFFDQGYVGQTRLLRGFER